MKLKLLTSLLMINGLLLRAQDSPDDQMIINYNTASCKRILNATKEFYTPNKINPLKKGLCFMGTAYLTSMTTGLLIESINGPNFSEKYIPLIPINGIVAGSLLTYFLNFCGYFDTILQQKRKDISHCSKNTNDGYIRSNSYQTRKSTDIETILELLSSNNVYHKMTGNIITDEEKENLKNILNKEKTVKTNLRNQIRR